MNGLCIGCLRPSRRVRLSNHRRAEGREVESERVAKVLTKADTRSIPFPLTPTKLPSRKSQTGPHRQPRMFLVVKDETASVSAAYVRHVGSVSVTLDGPKDAKWTLNGEGAYESGYKIDSVPTGSHKVTFSEVSD